MKNLKMVQRMLRYILGILLFTWAICGGPLWCYIGLYFIGTAAWGYCPVWGSVKGNKVEE